MSPLCHFKRPMHCQTRNTPVALIDLLCAENAQMRHYKINWLKDQPRQTDIERQEGSQTTLCPVSGKTLRPTNSESGCKFVKNLAHINWQRVTRRMCRNLSLATSSWQLLGPATCRIRNLCALAPHQHVINKRTGEVWCGCGCAAHLPADCDRHPSSSSCLCYLLPSHLSGSSDSLSVFITDVRGFFNNCN